MKGKKERKSDDLIPLTEFFEVKKIKIMVSRSTEKNQSLEVNSDENISILLNEIRELKILIKSFISSQNVVVYKSADINKKRPTPPKFENKQQSLGYGQIHAELMNELKEALRRRGGNGD